ncbi:MAG: putative F420-dependent oxidoreductase, Rv2161c family [Ilumatobacteraceae bacterium]|nr:putative F420-dependent oxidoreductase, Rv2161c family [Ilumatobacteraceae bacterium]
MDIGLAVPISGSWATVPNIAEISEIAERSGYHSIWTFQRLLSGVGPDDEPTLAPQYRSVLDPLALMAYLAAITTRVRLGVAVLNLPFVAPIVTAKALTTIDILSSGRLDVGFGTGWQAEEFDAVGVSIERRGARANDYLACLEAIWRGGIVEHHGEFYDVPRSLVDPPPVQRPHPPVLLGGLSDAALRRAGRLANGWISSSQADLSKIDQSIDIVRAAAADAGRDADALRFVCRGVVKLSTEQRSPLVGTFEQIRADLADLAARGVTEVFVDLNFDSTIGSPDADPEESMRRAREILSELAPG